MSLPQFIDETISVEASITSGAVHPRSITWRNKKYSVVSVGRQWVEADITHILVELNDGGRMEIMMYSNFTWQLHRYWPPTFTA